MASLSAIVSERHTRWSRELTLARVKLAILANLETVLAEEGVVDLDWGASAICPYIMHATGLRSRAATIRAQAVWTYRTKPSCRLSALDRQWAGRALTQRGRFRALP